MILKWMVGLVIIINVLPMLRNRAIIEEVYDALIDAGASEEKARAAARSIANYDNQFSKIKVR